MYAATELSQGPGQIETDYRDHAGNLGAKPKGTLTPEDADELAADLDGSQGKSSSAELTSCALLSFRRYPLITSGSYESLGMSDQSPGEVGSQQSSSACPVRKFQGIRGFIK